MKTYNYDVERGYFVNSVGGAVGIVPTLVYGEQAQWRFFFKTAAGGVYDLSDITELNAAVGVAGGGIVAATTEGIALDVTAGSVTVPINCLTEQFYNATVGKPNGVYGFFELTGYDAAQGKALYIRFNTLLNEVVNPDIQTIPGLPDMILGVVSSGGYVKRTEALTSGAAIDTIIGGSARLTVASGGIIRLAVGSMSGETFVSSASLVVSSGAVVVDGQFRTGGGDADIGGNVTAINVSAYSVTADANVNAGGNVAAGESVEAQVDVNAGGNVNAGGSMTAGGRPVATQLVTSTSDDPSALIEVLSGGTSLFYTGNLYNVEVSSVVKTTEASYLHFTLDSVTAPTPVVISGVSYLNSATFEGGKEYLVGIFDGMAVVNEVTSGGAQQ